MLLGTIALGGCSLQSARDGARLSISMPNPHSFSQSNLSGGSSGLAPSAWNAPEFVCYGVNVTGPGIADSSLKPNPNPSVQGLLAGTTSCAYRGVVSNGFTFSAGQSETTIDLQVPPGTSRVIQLVGITNPAFCGANFLDNAIAGSPGAYEIGRTVADLFGDATVSIGLNYVSSESKRVDCGGSAATVVAVNITAPAAGAYVTQANQSAVTIAGTCSESGQPVVVKVNGNPVGANPTCASGNWSGVFDLSNVSLFPDGSLTLTADHASSGGVQAPLSSRVVAKDATPPAAPSAASWIEASPSNAAVVNASWASSDPSVVDTKVQYYSDASCGTAVGSPVDVGTNKTAAFSVPADGVYSYRVTVFDGVGNSTGSTCSTSITTDATPPAAATGLAWMQGSTTNLTALTAQWTKSVSTDLADQKIQFYQDGACTTPSGSLIDLASASAVSQPFLGADGMVYSFKLKSLDSAGNSTDSACSPSITVDTVAPTVAIANPTAGSFVTAAHVSSFTVSGNCSENGRNVVVSGSASATVVCTGGAWSANLDFSGASEGTVTINVSHADAAGNSANDSRSFTKDTVVPTVAITSPAAGSYVNISNKTAFVVSGSCTENGQNVVISGAGSATVACSSGAWSVSLDLSAAAEGAITLYADHADAAGNPAAQASRNFTKDTIAPNVTVSAPTNGFYFNTLAQGTSLPMSGNCSENGQPVNIVAGSATATPTCTGGNWSAALDLTSVAPGSITIAVTHPDVAGNAVVSPPSVTITKETTAALVLNSANATTLTPNFTVRGNSANDSVVLLAGADGACAGGRVFGAAAAADFNPLPISTVESLSADVSATESFRAKIVKGGTAYCSNAISYTYPVRYGIAKVALGTGFSCLLFTSTGEVRCAGDNSNGQLGDGTMTSRPTYANVKSGGSNLLNATDLVAGDAHVCALLSSGTVVCWGQNTFGQIGDASNTNRNSATAVSGISAVSSLSAGANHNCALSGGSVYCWGQGASGQLGNNAVAASNVPVAAGSLGGTATLVAAGGNNTCAYVNSSNIKCWGAGANGQLGYGTMVPTLNAPGTAVTGTFSGLTALGVGGLGTICAIAAGQLKCWGANSYGQIGNGTVADQASPVVISVAPTPIGLAMGMSHTCVVSSGGYSCWGDGSAGQLGDSSVLARQSPPTMINLPSAVANVAAHGVSTCAVDSSGRVWCWGGNTFGQFGNGFNDVRKLPQPMSLTNVTNVAAGQYHTCAIASGGMVSCWGQNSSGQIGNNTTISSTAPVSLFNQGGAAIAIRAGGNHTCIVLSTGGVQCWGYNSNGQLGSGSTSNQLGATSVSTLSSGVTALAAGLAHTCALLSDGSMKCWGLNSSGQLGDGTTTQATTPVVVTGGLTATAIAAGQSHTCALLSDQTVKCWGLNSSGQLGDGTTTQRTSPVAVSGITNAVAIAAGALHTCAVLSDGSARCWGAGNSGQLGNGSAASSSSPVVVTGASTFVSIVANSNSSCAKLSNGKVQCWGANNSGSLATGTLTGSNVPMASAIPESPLDLVLGAYHGCAVGSGGGLTCWGDNSMSQYGPRWESMPSLAYDVNP
ncbi:MAG: hypothetical protein JST04_05400 [Bdellovibrionales bacterium]|nr:hypothetical protein [Bdellovibrionales bacterium]